MKKQKSEKAFWQYCRECGCEYLEPKSWVIRAYPHETECPRCGNKLAIDEND